MVRLSIGSTYSSLLKIWILRKTWIALPVSLSLIADADSVAADLPERRTFPFPLSSLIFPPVVSHAVDFHKRRGSKVLCERINEQS